jgi:hypothetical protein
MTPWELQTCVQGWNAAHGAEAKPEPMSDAAFERLKAVHGIA